MSLKRTILDINAEILAQYPIPPMASREEKMLHVINVLARGCIVLYNTGKRSYETKTALSFENADLRLRNLELQQLLRRQERELTELRNR